MQNIWSPETPLPWCAHHSEQHLPAPHKDSLWQRRDLLGASVGDGALSPHHVHRRGARHSKPCFWNYTDNKRKSWRFKLNLWHLKGKKSEKHASYFLSLVRQIGILLILVLKYLAIQAVRERKHLFVITFLWCLEAHCQGWFFRPNPATWGWWFELISLWQPGFLERASWSCRVFKARRKEPAVQRVACGPCIASRTSCPTRCHRLLSPDVGQCVFMRAGSFLEAPTGCLCSATLKCKIPKAESVLSLFCNETWPDRHEALYSLYFSTAVSWSVVYYTIIHGFTAPDPTEDMLF